MMGYTTRAEALAGGLTHEGTLFWVPAWFAGDGEDIVYAAPKFRPLHAWCMLVDSLLEALSYVTPADRVLASPIKVVRRIPQ